MYINMKRVHKLIYCPHRPQLKVNLFCYYFDQTRFAEFFQRTFLLFSIFHLSVLFSLCACILLTFNNLHLSLSTLHWGLRLQLTIWGKVIQLLYYLQAVKTILKKRYIESKKCSKVSKFHLWVQCQVSRAIKESIVSSWGNAFSSLFTEFLEQKKK